MGGRSPRARGRLSIAWLSNAIVGSIPACAGKALYSMAKQCHSGVDPRVRGEGFDGHDAGTLTPGRSPRARGRHIATIRDLLKDRSIPACAGKARKSKGGDLARRVDPRVRGEGTDYGDQGNPRRGRSPRARGRHARGETAGDRIRSIPACAGKAEHSHHCRYRKQVDPRVRGEGCTGSYEESRAGGRSPRARGRR